MSSITIQYRTLVSFLIGMCLPFSAVALDRTNISQASPAINVTLTVFSKTDLQQTMALQSRPFIQLMEYNAEDVMPPTEDNSQLGLFEMAMQVQDRVHYYIDVLDSSFSPSPQSNYEPEECQPSGFANVAKFFSF